MLFFLKTRLMPLTKEAVAIVDADSYEALCVLGNWCLNSQGYAVQWYRNDAGRRTARLMHRLILDAPAHLQVDHIDGDRLNNTRANLRLATRSQNMANRRSPRTNSSGYKGVSWTANRWQAHICYQHRRLYLGRYRDPQVAALAYDIAARALFVEFARCNFTPEEASPEPPELLDKVCRLLIDQLDRLRG
jgi:hypothetical protein